MYYRMYRLFSRSGNFSVSFPVYRGSDPESVFQIECLARRLDPAAHDYERE